MEYATLLVVDADVDLLHMLRRRLEYDATIVSGGHWQGYQGNLRLHVLQGANRISVPKGLLSEWGKIPFLYFIFY